MSWGASVGNILTSNSNRFAAFSGKGNRLGDGQDEPRPVEATSQDADAPAPKQEDDKKAASAPESNEDGIAERCSVP